ncbi:MAG: hypothetical protein PHX70_13125 [Clostridium sp.]|nr:hypothetical protein [Clostridium sp.]
MKNFKLKKPLNLCICLLLIVCVSCSCSSNSSQKSSDSSDKVDTFLEENHASIDVNKNSGFNLMDSDIKNNRVILTGEAHAIAKNYQVKLALLKYLNKKYKVKALLTELSYSDSCYINEYLQSGDESELKTVYNNIQGTFAWNKSEYNSWIELRKYNLTVPKNQRIKVVGIDIEHQLPNAYDYLNSILPNNPPPAEIQVTIAQLTDKNKLQTDKSFRESTAVNLSNDMKSKPYIYKSYLGNHYFDFNIVVDNMINSINAYSNNGENFDKVREPDIYSNFKRLYAHSPAEKYFGEFGGEHIYQSHSTDYVKDFAMYLKDKDSPIKGKVISIAYGYKNCYFMDMNPNHTHTYIQVKAESPITNMLQLDKHSATDVTLFKLNGANSPFNNEKYFIKNPKGGHTTDYFQYIILIKNSKGTTPLGTL